ncbi:hypothetical protein KGO95_03370 [Patescibacteria group bacterium]|nr:hypothetical protein [Patescibacteria group bacterium]
MIKKALTEVFYWVLTLLGVVDPADLVDSEPVSVPAGPMPARLKRLGLREMPFDLDGRGQRAFVLNEIRSIAAGSCKSKKVSPRLLKAITEYYGVKPTGFIPMRRVSRKFRHSRMLLVPAVAR